MNSREIIFSLILFVTAVLLWQLVKDEDPETTDNFVSQEKVPGYYLNGAKMTRYDKNGQAEYTITADTIEQNLATNDLELSNIQVNYHTQGSWVINADSALLPSNRKNINFSGNVLAAQEDNKNTTQFSSNSLVYNIETQELKTEDSIRAIKGQQIVSAKGMTLDLKNQRILLESRVKIRFKP